MSVVRPGKWPLCPPGANGQIEPNDTASGARSPVPVQSLDRVMAYYNPHFYTVQWTCGPAGEANPWHVAVVHCQVGKTVPLVPPPQEQTDRMSGSLRLQSSLFGSNSRLSRQALHSASTTDTTTHELDMLKQTIKANSLLCQFQADPPVGYLIISGIS